jgi:hypothetical protein
MVKTYADKIADNCVIPLYKYSMRLLGPIMVLSLHGLILVHVYAFFGFIVAPLKKRLGTIPSLGWQAIGLALLFNIVFNHTLAMVVKPGSPHDLR